MFIGQMLACCFYIGCISYRRVPGKYVNTGIVLILYNNSCRLVSLAGFMAAYVCKESERVESILKGVRGSA